VGAGQGDDGVKGRLGLQGVLQGAEQVNLALGELGKNARYEHGINKLKSEYVVGAKIYTALTLRRSDFSCNTLFFFASNSSMILTGSIAPASPKVQRTTSALGVLARERTVMATASRHFML
jgi:hypothetical protein